MSILWRCAGGETEGRKGRRPAISTGSSLQAHALNHNFYIVTATLQRDCTVVDITGEVLLYENRPGVSARKLAAQYGLEELRPYLARSRREADRLRGWEFPGSPNPPRLPCGVTSPRKSG